MSAKIWAKSLNCQRFQKMIDNTVLRNHSTKQRKCRLEIIVLAEKTSMVQKQVAGKPDKARLLAVQSCENYDMGK